MAVLNVSPTPQKKYVHQRNEPEIIEIFLRYITRTGRSDCFPPAYVGYLGFSPKCTVTNLIEEFLKTQSVFKNTSGFRARHEIVSFQPDEYMDCLGVCQIVPIAYHLANWYFNQGFQVVFAIHADTPNLHIHFVINTVSFITGKKYHCNYSQFRNQKDYLESVITKLTQKNKKLPTLPYNPSGPLLDASLFYNMPSICPVQFMPKKEVLPSVVLKSNTCLFK